MMRPKGTPISHKRMRITGELLIMEEGKDDS